MNIERAILISFLGNFIINNIVGAIVALLKVGTGGTPTQYAVYIAFAAVFAAVFTWWHLMTSRDTSLVNGIIFGAVAFVVAVATSLISGIAGVLAQTGSFSQLAAVLPNFWAFLANWPTLALLGYWVIPGAIVGFLMGGMSKKQGMSSMGTQSAPRPMI